jgi:hypothetical protein
MNDFETNKTCSKCQIEKPVSQFNKARANKDGLRGCCKDCELRWNQEYRESRASMAAVIPELKTCPCCKLVKGNESFSRNKTTKDGLCYYCRGCDENKKKRRREENMAREVVSIPDLKTCPSCKTEKSGLDFNKARSKNDGLSSFCKQCNSMRQKEAKFGITKAWFPDTLKAQDNKCVICRSEFTKENPPCVDHNHQTDEVRGLLCGRCNFLLGNARESIEILQKAMDYLVKYNGGIVNNNL